MLLLPRRAATSAALRQGAILTRWLVLDRLGPPASQLNDSSASAESR